MRKIRNSKSRDRNKEILYLGGKDGERLYLHNLEFKITKGQKVRILKTKEPGVDMADLITRHKGRYGLVALFCRPGFHVLDFPCGSGYAADFLKEFGVSYHGRDIDGATIEYARRIYGGKNALFEVGNLCSPKLEVGRYDVIGCIEGLEHIDQKYQESLIAAFYKALKPDGILIISSPENSTGVSGPSKLNKFHKYELTKNDFLSLLYAHFGPQNVELATHKAVLSPGLVLTTCFYGICRKYGQDTNSAAKIF